MENGLEIDEDMCATVMARLILEAAEAQAYV